MEKDGFYVEGSFDEALDRAQRAIEEIARSKVEEVEPPDWADMIDFFESLRDESDRAIPILAFTYIDGQFMRLLREALNPGVAGGIKALLGPMGPLATAGARINMAHALEWISDEIAHDLHVLRRIRNRYAHRLMDEGLRDSKTIEDVLKHKGLIRVLDALLPHMKNSFKDSDLDARVMMPLRDLLIASYTVSAWTSLAQMYVAPVSIRTGISPASLLDHNSESAPKAIVDQYKSFRRLIEGLLVGPIDKRAAEIVEAADRMDTREEE